MSHHATTLQYTFEDRFRSRLRLHCDGSHLLAQRQLCLYLFTPGLHLVSVTWLSVNATEIS
jgi:hypothetical protein